MSFTIQTPEQLSAHLTALREEAGLTQAELGFMHGVGQPRMAKIEKDPLSISVGQLLHILGLLNAQIVIKKNSTLPSLSVQAAGRVARTHRSDKMQVVELTSNKNAKKSAKGNW